ncbi:sigma-70 family RNA polymerase sigma factor [Bosea sp. BK604]|uniref:sigma-70 family RNA polymerase sigma factor n=1 Tax=Bosea sp. BK604 TaxID=2512180 RepID=UPI001049A380|nr:sigma-70 family RNA polymerase sigma factor [Bosea sp. BK604]TCR62107.1 RNA polymerase sigma-70 factor (ECF subfamily) [Bosea sp. BK604]
MAPDDHFETHRRFLTGLAYRMLGSVSDAEDIVQDAWLRWREAEHGGIDNPRAYLARIVTRLCLDQMKSARSRREFYVGGWLPEPLVESLGGNEPIDEELDAPIALMLALERLSPLERAAFLLHDVFELDFAEIARTIDRSESACRQLAKRAREHVRLDTPPRNKVSADEAARFAKAFFEAAHRSDPTALQKLLAQDVALHADGGGKVNAVLNPIFGAENVALFYAGIAMKVGPNAPGASYQPLFINGLPGYVSRESDGVLQSVALDIRDGLIQAVYVIRNPDKLRHVAGPI